MYRYEYSYKDRNGKMKNVRGMTLFPTRDACDRALCDRMSDYVEQGYENVSGDIIEVEE